MTLLDHPGTRGPVGPSPDELTAEAAARRRRRRRLLAWSLLPGLVALVAAVALIGRAVTTQRGIDALSAGAFEPGEAADAVEWFDRSEWINLYDREGPAFNRGVAWFADGELERARAEFEDALGRAGDSGRCRVVVNLALTIEAQGDALAEPDPHGSQGLYGEAKGVAEGNPACLAKRTPEGDGAGDRLQRLLDRLAEKLTTEESREVVRPRADPDATREPDDEFRQLEQQLDDNARKRSEGRELEEGVELNPTISGGPQW